MSNINTFLTKIQTLNKENIIDVDVPSLSGTVKFLPLSVKQQKDLIKSSLDGSLAGIYINNTINNIILENNIDKHQLLVIDKLPIIVALRVQAFGSTYQVNEQDVELSIILPAIAPSGSGSPSNVVTIPTILSWIFACLTTDTSNK